MTPFRSRRRKTPSLAAFAILAGLSCPAAAQTAPPDFAPLVEAAAPFRGTVDMVRVPAGRYPIGREDGPAAERPAHAVALEAFLIDRTEVTNAAFAAFLEALDLPVSGDAPAGRIDEARAGPEAMALLTEGREGIGRYPLIALDDAQARIGVSDGRFRSTPGYGDHPVTETTFAGAAAFCRWRGGRLPTEVEWEAAARGPDGRPYPWGAAAPDGDRVFTSGRTGVTAPVGSRPAGASAYGALDMAGSLAEWTSTLRRPYPYEGGDGREDPAAAGERVTRGGDYIYDDRPGTLTATHRTGFSNAPHRGHRHIGFRCAADAPPR